MIRLYLEKRANYISLVDRQYTHGHGIQLYTAQLPKTLSHLPSTQSVTSGGFEIVYFYIFHQEILKVHLSSYLHTQIKSGLASTEYKA